MTATLRPTVIMFAFLFVGQATGCSDGGGGAMCTPGALGCECNMGACLEGLECVAGTCSEPGGDSSGSGDEAEGSEGSGDSSGDSSGATTDGDTDSGSSSEGTSGSTVETDGSGETNMCGPDEELCGGNCIDLSSDVENCGLCGMTCNIALDAGGCEDGECLPSWTECMPAQDPTLSCDEVCQSVGATCVTSGCEGGNIVWYLGLSSCERNVPSIGGTIPCDLSTEPASDYFRCCCQQ